MIWLSGFLLVILYRTLNAGMKSDSLFYFDYMDWDNDFRKKVKVRKFDGENLFFYVMITLGVGLTWPLSIPVLGVYLLGKRLAK